MSSAALTEFPSLDDLVREYSTPSVSAAYLLCDRHDPESIAFQILDSDLDVETLTFGDLTRRSSQFANLLADRGVSAGDRVAVLAGKSAHLIVALVGIWRLGAVHVPLFTAFSTTAIRQRLEGSRPLLAIADSDQVHKLDGIEGFAVVTTGVELDALLDREPVTFSAHVGGGDADLVHLYTSGTTGNPKAVPVPVRALASFVSYLHYGLDVAADDVYWNAADPGWAYGLYYGILAPLAAGQANILLRAAFSAALTARVLRELEVTNFAAAPTIYRALRREPTASDLTLRRASSAGEPLTPDIPSWTREQWGVSVRDHYGQTELGMVIGNAWHHSLLTTVAPGSMGQEFPGFRADIVNGQIALDRHASALMWFAGYVDAPHSTAEHFTADGQWYLTGDVGHRDDEGRFHFTGRADDVILTAGYRIGPFEVESVLTGHPAVADVAVVGKPDEMRGEILVAFVVLVAGEVASGELSTELQLLVKQNYAAHAFPREVIYVDALPKTPSGKVQRFILREQFADTPGTSNS